METLSPAMTGVQAPEIALSLTPLNERKEVLYTNAPALTISRKQLYDEVWELSALGAAKKYGIPYQDFLQQIKAYGIPIPPAGYWTKISFGKPVEKLPLSGDPEESLSLTLTLPRRRTAYSKAPKADVPVRTADVKARATIPDKATAQRPENTQERSTPETPNEVKTIRRYGQTYNVYDRETLYQEVWQAPVTDVSKRYKVSDTTIRKICRALDVPLPPQGYWAKLRAGKEVSKRPPLPKAKTNTTHVGPQTGLAYQPRKKQNREDSLGFLAEEDLIALVAAADHIRVPGEGERMHSKIIAHRKVIAAWKKEHKDDLSARRRPRYAPKPPFLVGAISEESIPRACHILDALAKAIEPLGGKFEDDLTFKISGESVRLSFSEGKDKVEHTLTKEENRKLLEYQEERKRYHFASAPQIPKYDYPYNGRLSLDISMGKSFRDSSVPLEERLGDVLCAMYIAAENTKQERLKREEAERQRQEEQRKREERRKRHDAEVEQTLALEHEAEDYDTACKIRRYIQAHIAAHPGEDLSEWVEWATAKADWYDPTVSREDEFFGVRDHAESKDRKAPKYDHRWY